VVSQVRFEDRPPDSRTVVAPADGVHVYSRV